MGSYVSVKTPSRGREGKEASYTLSHDLIFNPQASGASKASWWPGALGKGASLQSSAVSRQPHLVSGSWNQFPGAGDSLALLDMRPVLAPSPDIPFSEKPRSHSHKEGVSVIGTWCSLVGSINHSLDPSPNQGRGSWRKEPEGAAAAACLHLRAVTAVCSVPALAQACSCF